PQGASTTLPCGRGIGANSRSPLPSPYRGNSWRDREKPRRRDSGAQASAIHLSIQASTFRKGREGLMGELAKAFGRFVRYVTNRIKSKLSGGRLGRWSRGSDRGRGVTDRQRWTTPASIAMATACIRFSAASFRMIEAECASTVRGDNPNAIAIRF